MAKKTEIKTIKFEVDGQTLEVSVDAAKKLKELLDDLFGRNLIVSYGSPPTHWEWFAPALNYVVGHQTRDTYIGDVRYHPENSAVLGTVSKFNPVMTLEDGNTPELATGRDFDINWEPSTLAPGETR